MNASTRMGALVVDELCRHGVRDAVLAPGSRSAPLAFALHAAAAAGLLRLHVRVDERSAGFLALGLARGSHRPVPVVTTSGSAVAHLYPAVLEAHHAGLPLLVVSADRPAELRGSGANQTTEQPGLFGRFVRWSADVPADAVAVERGDVAVAAWRAQVSRALIAATGVASRDPGPVHLNVCFAAPLVPDSAADSAQDLSAEVPGRPSGRPWTSVAAGHGAGQADMELPLGPPTVVVAGDDAGPPARLLAERAGWPLIAEPTSGARTGACALRTGSQLLAHAELADRVQRVVVAGRPTLSRSVTALLSRADVEVVALTRGPRWSDQGHRVAVVASTVTVPGPDDPAWLAAWRTADEAAAEAVERVLAEAADVLPSGVLLGPLVARALSRAVPPEGLLLVGSSHPVRDLDLVADPYPVGERRLVTANRGMSGIDGAVSTALGLALGRRSSRSLALLGDLTFLHDVGGLMVGPDEPRPDLTIVVANDDGGSIFATLEPGREPYAAAFERLFATPTGVDLGALCAAANVGYRRVHSLGDLADELEQPPGGVRVLEARVDRSKRAELAASVKGAVASAVSPS